MFADQMHWNTFRKHLEVRNTNSEITASSLHWNAAGMTCFLWNRRGFLDKKPTGVFNGIIARCICGKHNLPGNQKLPNDP